MTAGVWGGPGGGSGERDGGLQVSHLQPPDVQPKGLHQSPQRSQRGQTFARPLRPHRPGQGVQLLPVREDAFLLQLPGQTHAGPLRWETFLLRLLWSNLHHQRQHAQTPADTRPQGSWWRGDGGQVAQLRPHPGTQAASTRRQRELQWRRHVQWDEQQLQHQGDILQSGGEVSRV